MAEKVEKRVNLKKEKVKTFHNIGNITITYLPNVLLNLIAVVMIALITLVAFDFDWGYVWNWGFLITTVILTSIYIISHWSIFNGYLKGLRRNKDNVDKAEEVEKEIKKTTGTIEWAENKTDFINYRNMNKKIDAHIINTQNRLVNLASKAKEKDKEIESLGITEFQRKHLSEEEVLVLEAEYDKLKRENRYLNKKKELEERLTDEWIGANLNKINLDYDKIDPQFVETGYVLKGQRKSQENPKGKYGKDTLPLRVMVTVATVFITAFGIDLAMSSFSKEAWFLFSMRMTLLLLNIAMGLNYAETFFVDVDLYNRESRLSVCDEFKIWAFKKGIFNVKGETQ